MGLPFLLNLGLSSPIALYLSVVTGVAALLLTLLTDHHLGVLRIIPYKWHLIVDFVVGVIFVIAPFIFSFEKIDAYFYWINGGAVLIVVSLHKTEVAIA